MSLTIHQFLTGATAGDAITDQALLMRRWLREMGFESEIYAWHLHRSMEATIRPMTTIRRGSGEQWGIYHHSIGSDVPDFLARQNLRLILVYHNVTPAQFFEGTDPLRAHLARLGMEQLDLLRPHTALALADSEFNKDELVDAGYEQVAVLPICLKQERYDLLPVPEIASSLDGGNPRLLFIGRLAPNKRQEDLVKLLYFLRRTRPSARLVLVGDRWEVGYDKWVEQLASELGIGDGLTIAGKVTQEEMVTYIRSADCYVSMSEHEGFGLPLIESMYLGLPVFAYAATAVPETMGKAGVLFARKDFEMLAELIDLIVEDAPLRQRIIDNQKAHARKFLEPQVRTRFVSYLQQLGLGRT